MPEFLEIKGLEKAIDEVRKMRTNFFIVAPHLEKARPGLESFVKRNFALGGRPDKWVDKKDGSPSKLQKSGRLVNSITSKVIKGTIAIGTNLVYSRIHNKGGKTKAHTIVPRRGKALKFSIAGATVFAKKVNYPGSEIPKREFLIVTEEGLEIAAKIVAASIENEIK